MRTQSSRRGDHHRRQLSAAARRSGLPETLAHKHRAAWRRAIDGFASPMVRLHRLRNLKAQLLEDVLDRLDGCGGQTRDRDG